ncbi:MAG: methyltransferase domain-containing protein [Alphaproteobacteria bacterium]|nr:methyltransferase domain-containing protein [Alphaproteobacteria bacterium]MBF0130874.1 methyltransferase domain-containing protein [Alphaproteobacteria bacterium]
MNSGRSSHFLTGSPPEDVTRAVFSRMAPDYERNAILERASGERLLDMLALGPMDFVLDLGCGPGHLTRSIRARTGGKLVGVDASAGMVAQARWNARGQDITFLIKDAEHLDFEHGFHVLFCNSAFHWFSSPERVVGGCLRALRRGGWLGLQVPATRQWFTLARDVAAAAAIHPRTREVFSRFRNPIFALGSVEEYVSLFSGGGFDVHDAWLELETTRHTPKEAFALFQAMAGAAFFNPNCYGDGADGAFFADLAQVAGDVIATQTADDGLIDVTVQRLYLFAVKPLTV